MARPEVIYLEPDCDDCDEYDGCWREDEPGDCDECGAESTKYIRADLHMGREKTANLLASYEAEIFHLRRSLNAPLRRFWCWAFRVKR